MAGGLSYFILWLCLKGIEAYAIGI